MTPRPPSARASSSIEPWHLPSRDDLSAILHGIYWAVDVFVPGRAAPQGSKKVVARGHVVEMSKYVGTWRDDVRAACLQVKSGPPLDGPLVLEVEFVRKRPAGAPKSRTPAASTAPDLSKLVRSTEDAITSSGLWADDARVVVALAWKRVAEIDETPGANIRIGVPTFPGSPS